ncbi:solute carrier family 22 member 13-like [Watersipora subatra]|uniref:solute carrier family 22 member 13-like n=1 Tax=Watersipora subatra TaxID=2589382 RepID=UPI00355B6F40
MCAVEGFAYICCFCVAWWGRKWPAVGVYLGGGISLLVSILLMKYAADSVAITILSFTGKFCISAAWQIILIWHTEVYPTTYRCTLTVLNGVVGRIGIVSAPYMVDMDKYIDVPNEEFILPSIYVVLMISVGLLHIIPPETNNRKLPETLFEANVRSFPMAKKDEDFKTVEQNKLLDDVATKI